MKPEKEIRPPKWADVLLKLFCSEHVIETLQGDLYELYEKRRNKSSKLKADYSFVGDVISSIRPFALKRFLRTKNSNNMSMFKNYLKVGWRSLLKNKMYSAIKIGGLSVGIAAGLLIALFVIEELSHDQDHPNGEQIYRLINVITDPANPEKWTSHQPMVARMLKEQFSEIEESARLIPHSGWSFAGSNQVRRADRVQNTYEEGFAYIDQEFLDIFQPKMVYGDRASALVNPNSIVITKKKAEKYFPGENPIGKTLILDEVDDRPWEIGGVIEDPADNQQFPYDFYLTLTGEEFWNGEQTNWCCSNYIVYLKLHETANPDALEEKMVQLFKESFVPYLKERGDQFADNVEKYREYDLQPVKDVYLYSEGIGSSTKRSDIKIVWMFSAVALFILLLACINFINLSTAKSANRAKEVGLRKVVGSFRMDLVKQFLTESILVTALATVLGILLARLIIPLFNIISGKTLVMPFEELWFYPSAIGLVLIIGFIAGIYPSFYLSSFSPIDVIHGKLSRGAKTSTLRNVMVIFQFTCSIILIVSSVVVYKQMHFILNKDLGYDKEQVVIIEGANTLRDKLNLFQNRLLEDPNVLNVSASNYLPISGTKRDQNGFWNEGKSAIDKSVGAQVWRVDDDYAATLGMNIIQGRDFDKASTRDSLSLIINETMAKELGLKDPIGARIENWQTWTVIGVIQDFHFESMRGGIGPLAMALGRFGSNVLVKVQTENMKETLEDVSTVWDEFMPAQPIRYSFMDNEYASMYEDVQRMGDVFSSFAILAIIVACLGLFGLSAFMVEQRIKEISIRKVLGASAQLIFRLLTSNFLKLIFISLLIAIPVSVVLMNEWLSDFEYRVELSWTIYLFAGLLITTIAILTISFESIKAALVNPVKGLRSE